MFRYYSPAGTDCTPAVAPLCSRPAAAKHDTHTHTQITCVRIHAGHSHAEKCPRENAEHRW